MGKPATRPDDISALIDRVERLERLIREMDSSRRAGSTAIENGGRLTVRGGLVAEDVDGSPLVAIGQDRIPGIPGSDQAFVTFARSNGRPFLRMYGQSADKQFWALYDQSGNIIVGDDIDSGQGLARPYVPLPWRDPASPSIRSTSSATGETMYTLTLAKQHPFAWVLVQLTCSEPATAGTVTLRTRDGLQLDSQPIPAGGNVAIGLRGPVPGPHLGTVQLDLVVTRTAGTGSIRTELHTAYGMQS